MSDLISREALKEDFKTRLALCNEWIEKAKDKETKIRASAVKAFIGEVIMTIDNAPTVKAYTFEEVESIRNEALDFARNSYERPHGKWEDYSVNFWKCPECGYLLNKHCPQCYNDVIIPNCGAQMSEEVQE